jgi:hypothetical protein
MKLPRTPELLTAALIVTITALAASGTEPPSPADQQWEHSTNGALQGMDSKGIEKGSVSRLDIVDHGRIVKGASIASAVQKLGRNPLTVAEMKLFEPYLPPGGIVTFYGCFVGLNSYYLWGASNAFGGRTVYAPAGRYFYDYRIRTYINNGELQNINIYKPLENPVNNRLFAHSP